MAKMTLRAPHNYDTMAASDEAGLHCQDESLAQQHQKEEADINVIVKRFGLTGELPQGVRMPQYGDFTAVTDYQTALNAVQAANNAFAQMPAHVRSRFDNDPEKFVAFCLDEKNRDEAEKLGLVGPSKKEEPKPEPAPAPAPAPKAGA